jgi:hypothetical protein
MELVMPQLVLHKWLDFGIQIYIEDGLHLSKLANE